ncbi:Uncharacterized protein APZ42_017646 [Daphnia magna]|uniref:Uncharacterized protein n=1 Tax=Daphnia magna TaxID=35525 RepID=A0A162CKT1_9CRUS|nr:Uncharacterized protein APZ42_017646 [Daphnia magna]
MNSISSTTFKMIAKLIVVCLMLAVNQVYAGVNHGLQTGGFGGAATYGTGSGAGGFAGSSLVSPLASSGFASPYGAQGGNYLQGKAFFLYILCQYDSSRIIGWLRWFWRIIIEERSLWQIASKKKKE